MVRPVPAGRRGSCCTPYSRLQEEIDNVETIAVTANNTANNASQLAQQALTRDTFDDVNVNGDLNVYGDIIQQGAAYETHAQHVFSTDDYIVMRDGALVGLAVGDYSGFQVKKYDGTNDGRLVIDRDGTARVGDVGDEQPLLTRDESADMTDAAPLVWDAANSKAITGVFPVSDPGVASINGIAPDADNDFTIEAGSNITITSGTNKITIAAAGGGSGQFSWRSSSNTNWSDMFDVSGSDIIAKKDIWITYRSPMMSTYIPKGMKATSIYIPVSGTEYLPSEPNTIRIYKGLEISSAWINNSLVRCLKSKVALTTDGSSISVSESEDFTTYYKSNISLYVRD